MKYVLLTLCLLLHALPGQAAAIAAADQGGGYSGHVLERVGKVWQPQSDAQERQVRVKVSIDGEGKLVRCEPLSSTASAMGDKSICSAVREAGAFPVPPYAAPIDIFMTFWTGPAKAQAAPQQAQTILPPTQAAAPAPAQHNTPAPKEKPQVVEVKPETKAETKVEAKENSVREQEAEYIKKVKGEISSRVGIPPKTPKGQYTVSVRVRLSSKGQVTLVGLSKSCGRLDMDQAITGAVSRTGLVAGSPFKKTREYNLSFSIQVP